MTIRQQINNIAKKRILVLDGAMGSLLKNFNPDKNCIDNLCLANPQIITGIHNAYLEAGADIIRTCSFNSTSIELEKHDLEHHAYDISAASARIARECANRYSNADKPRFVAGSLGPTAKSASLYPDINNPGKRNIDWETLDHAYYDNARGLLDGGADILILETAFDTLNIKAAIYAISWLMIEREIDIPVIISATVSDDGKLLSGQTLEAFCIAVQHINPLAIGLNCSCDAEKLFPFVRTISDYLTSQSSPCLVCAYPKGGTPNDQGFHEETPQAMTEKISVYLKEKKVNIIGGCCGSTPAHIEALAKKVKEYSPRAIPTFREANDKVALCGLEPLYLKENDINEFVKKIDKQEVPALIGDFHQALVDGEFEKAVNFARDLIDSGTSILPIEIEDKKILDRFLDYAIIDQHLSKLPFYIKSSNLKVLETGLKRLQGKSLAGPVDSTHEQLIRRYGAYPVIAV